MDFSLEPVLIIKSNEWQKEKLMQKMREQKYRVWANFLEKNENKTEDYKNSDRLLKIKKNENEKPMKFIIWMKEKWIKFNYLKNLMEFMLLLINWPKFDLF